MILYYPFIQNMHRNSDAKNRTDKISTKTKYKTLDWLLFNIYISCFYVFPYLPQVNKPCLLRYPWTEAKTSVTRT
jgi:hypothetical protein